jgi:hypothetical protein
MRLVERYHENADCCCRVRYGVSCTGFRAVRELLGMERSARRSGQRQIRVRRRVVQRSPRRSDGSPRRAAGSGLCSDEAVMAFEHVLDALQLQCLPGESVVPDQLQLNFGRRPSKGS